MTPVVHSRQSLGAYCGGREARGYETYIFSLCSFFEPGGAGERKGVNQSNNQTLTLFSVPSFIDI